MKPFITLAVESAEMQTAKLIKALSQTYKTIMVVKVNDGVALYDKKTRCVLLTIKKPTDFISAWAFLAKVIVNKRITVNGVNIPTVIRNKSVYNECIEICKTLQYIPVINLIGVWSALLKRKPLSQKNCKDMGNEINNVLRLHYNIFKPNIMRCKHNVVVANSRNLETYRYMQQERYILVDISIPENLEGITKGLTRQTPYIQSIYRVLEKWNRSYKFLYRVNGQTIQSTGLPFPSSMPSVISAANMVRGLLEQYNGFKEDTA